MGDSWHSPPKPDRRKGRGQMKGYRLVLQVGWLDDPGLVGASGRKGIRVRGRRNVHNVRETIPLLTGS